MFDTKTVRLCIAPIGWCNDKRVGPAVAKAVAEAARSSGVAKI